MSKKLLFALALIAFPAVSRAQATAESILGDIYRLLGLVVPILMVLALIYFFWGLAQFILNSGDEEKRGAGKHIMIWGIIALFVMVAVWGLVGVIADTFEINEERGPSNVRELIPTL